ncbi:SCO7613 C-terminal domain-containing membrane protein [Anaerobacillus sp. CMMVII]|uniref:SCO7613 C-terminal domain-containing membrane protein n=1 Tax=Anaerobacillus sp. CMMVII TaxID=2755588 RepID=UPI0037BF923B
MTHEVHHKKEYQKIAAWLLPISWLLALRSFYEEYHLLDTFYMNEVGPAGHVALSSLILLGISYVLRNYRARLFLPMFAIAISSYTLSLLAIITTNVLPVLQSSFLLVGTIVYVLLVYQTKNKQFWSLVSISTAALFLSLIEPLKLYENYSTLVVSLFLVPVILLIIYEFVGRKIIDLKPYFFWTAHSLLVIIIAGALAFQAFLNYQPLAFLIPLVIYTYSLFKQREEWGKNLFLYSALTQIPILVLLLIKYYTINFDYAQGLAFSTIMIGGLWGASRTEWKARVELFLIAIGMVSLVSFSILHQLDIIDVGMLVVIAAFVIMLLFRRKWELLTILPLFFAALSFYGYSVGLEKPMKIVAYIVVVIILHLVGKFSHTYLFLQEDKKYRIDWFTIVSPVFLFYIDHAILYNDPLWLKLIPYLFFVYLLYMQIGRVKGRVFKNIVMTATALSVLLPYYLVLDHVNVPELIAMEATMLPFIVLTIFLSKKAWSDYSKEMNIIQAIVLVLVAVFIVGDAIESNTLNDAIIVGGLSLLSIIAGMHYRIKSYFFVGIAVLLLNVFLQTKPFWGNLPWWMYLIIGGATLIGFASFYEWQKQRPTREGKTILQEKKEKFLRSFKDWK